jgi:hypothetical protein
MISTDIAMAQAIFMKKADGPDALKELPGNIWKFQEKILFMGDFFPVDVFIEAATVNDVEDTNQIFAIVEHGMSLHEVGVTGNQFQYARLFFRVAVTGNGKLTKADVKSFVKNQFHDVLFSACKVLGSRYPGLDLLIDTESAFPGKTSYQEVAAIHCNHITVMNGREVGGIGKQAGGATETPGDPV